MLFKYKLKNISKNIRPLDKQYDWYITTTVYEWNEVIGGRWEVLGIWVWSRVYHEWSELDRELGR